MSPLRIDVYNPKGQEWVEVGELNPGDRPGTISQNKPNGSRELYVFHCEPDDKSSIVYRAKNGVDITDSQTRVFIPSDLKEVARLRDGDPPYVLTVKTDVSEDRRIIRFTHQERK